MAFENKGITVCLLNFEHLFFERPQVNVLNCIDLCEFLFSRTIYK